jgi:hypothetical protein
MKVIEKDEVTAFAICSPIAEITAAVFPSI